VILPQNFDVASLYGEDYFYGRGFDKGAIIPEARQPESALVARRKYWLSLLAREAGAPGRLLDVGCGAGALLDVAAESNWQAHGQDIAAAGAAEARSRGHSVRVGELKDCNYETHSFDAATMIEVIEHLVDPRETLTTVRALLRPRGQLLIATGDIGSLGARLLGKRWGYLRPPGHVSYFTRPAMSSVLLQCGFDRVRFVPTFDLAFPSFPGGLTIEIAWLRGAAYVFRKIATMELCVIASAQ
jgi:SAM-dependent methyltransferase